MNTNGQAKALETQAKSVSRIRDYLRRMRKLRL
jgi:hypothetical protein